MGTKNCNRFVLKIDLLTYLNVTKTKRTAKFDGLGPRDCEDIKGIVAPEIGPKSHGTFEKQAPDATTSFSFRPLRK